MRQNASAEEIAAFTGTQDVSLLCRNFALNDTASTALTHLSATGRFRIQTHSAKRNLLRKTPIVAVEWITLANSPGELLLRDWNFVENLGCDLALRRAADRRLPAPCGTPKAISDGRGKCGK